MDQGCSNWERQIQHEPTEDVKGAQKRCTKIMSPLSHPSYPPMAGERGPAIVLVG